MSDIIFARTRHHYQSYTDYWRMVELSGFPTCYVDEIDPDSDRTYIVTPDNDEVRNAGWPDTPRAQIVLWDLEWRLEPMAPVRGVRRYWHMDKFVADRIGVEYAPMGGHLGLREQKPSSGPWYDVAFLGYMVPRRQAIAEKMRAHGAYISPSSAWGDERHNVLSRSHCYVHIHQLDDIQGVPALRLVVAAAYQLPFLSEYIDEPGKYRRVLGEFMHSYRFFEEEPLTWSSGFMGWVQQNGSNEWALALHEFLCYEFTFRKSVEASV